MNKSIKRLVIAGVSSGVGKTTIVTGLLAALKEQGLKVQSFKVGPDYIDPGYHFLASGRPAHNLDSWLVGEQNLQKIFVTNCGDADIAIIEGVMGLYDGGRGGMSSTAHIAKLLKAPVILVVNAQSMAESTAAVALGYKLYDQTLNFAGAIANKLGSKAHKNMVAEAFASAGIPLYGCLHRDEKLVLPERHLGLKPTTEHEAAAAVEAMKNQVISQVDIKALLQVAQNAPPLDDRNHHKTQAAKTVRIGVACDEAFSFYYPDSLQVLKDMGAEVIEFSPLADKALPEVDGLLFGGGFPEMFVQQLSQNTAIKDEIIAAAKRGMPIYAECGGLMYLCREIVDFDNGTYRMVGLIPAVTKMQRKLQTVGYVETTATTDNILCEKGDFLKGHEFHFSVMIPDQNDFPWAFTFSKTRTNTTYQGGYVSGNILASYLHMHFLGNEKAAARFMANCNIYKQSR